MWKSGLVVLICLFVNHVEPKSREKRFLFCMNFPDCCDFKGKDNCGNVVCTSISSVVGISKMVGPKK